jgi:hypothetical protein
MQLAFKRFAGLAFVAPENASSADPADDPFPERAARCGSQRTFHISAPLAHETRKCPQSRRKKRFQLLANSPRQHGCFAARADGNEYWGAVYYRGKDKTGCVGIVDDVYGYQSFARGSGYSRIDLRDSGCGNNRYGANQMGLGEALRDVLEVPAARKIMQLFEQLGRNDRNTRTRAKKQLYFSRRDTTASDDDDWLLAQLQEDGQVIHGRAGISGNHTCDCTAASGKTSQNLLA